MKKPFKKIAELLGLNLTQAAKALGVPKGSSEKVDYGLAAKYATGITERLAEALALLPEDKRKLIQVKEK